MSVKYDNDTQIVTSEYDTDSLSQWQDVRPMVVGRFGDQKNNDRMNKPQKTIYNFSGKRGSKMQVKLFPLGATVNQWQTRHLTRGVDSIRPCAGNSEYITLEQWMRLSRLAIAVLL